MATAMTAAFEAYSVLSGMSVIEIAQSIKDGNEVIRSGVLMSLFAA